VTEPAAKHARRWWKYILIFIGAGAFCILALTVYVNTESFQALVRRRLIAEIERITGGRAEIGSFHTVPFRMQVEVRNITVHGREAASDAPLAHADRIVARFKIISLLETEFAFDEVLLDQPAIHIAFYPDGTSNVPGRAGKLSSRASVERLFALSINRLDVREGQILWDDQNIPLDFAARNTSLQMEYSYLHNRYDGRLTLGMVETKLGGYRPFAWMTAAEFSLARDSLTVNTLQWNSGHSHVSANGQIANFRHPSIHAAYYANIDLSEAASVARQPRVRAGTFEVKGDGGWSSEQFESKGLLTISDLDWQNDRIAFSKASMSTGYVVTDQQITLSKLQGKVFGGSFAGDAEVLQWLAPDQHLSPAARKNLETATISAAQPLKKPKQAGGARPKAPAIQNARVSLRLRDISIENIATAVNAPSHPVQELHPAGSASGALEMRWKGTRQDAELHFNVDVVPPPLVDRPELPLTAHAEGTFYTANETLDLPQFNLATPTSHVQASGVLSSASSLRLSLSTSSLADWLPFLTVVRGPEIFPVTLNGKATFNGNLSGSLESPQLAGSLQVNNFEVNLPRTGQTRRLRTEWNSLSTSVQLSFSSVALHDAILRRDDSSTEFDGSATLDHGHITGDSLLGVRANLQNVDLAFLQSIARTDLPISGRTDLSIEISGTVANPQAEGKIHVTDAVAYGEAVHRFDSDFHWAQGEAEFSDLHLIYVDSTIAGNAAYNPATRVFRLDLAGNNLDLASIRQIRYDRLPLEGRFDFSIKATGTPDVPSINGNVRIHNLIAKGEPFGTFDLQAETQANELRLTGSSNLPRGSLTITGNVALRAGYPANLKAQMDQVDLDALWYAFVGNELTEHSSVNGSVTLQGPILQPSRWLVNGELTAVSLELEHINLHNQDPVLLTIANQSIEFTKAHLLGQGTDVNFHGKVQLDDPNTLDLTIDGRMDLGLLAVYNPNFSASGSVAVNTTVGGTYDEPLPQGRIQFANGTITYANFPSGLSDLNGTVLFTRDHARIEALGARTGGGTVALKGDATYVNQQLNFNLAASSKDVRLRYPPGVSSTANAELRWVGSRTSSTVSGEITINKIAVTPGFDFASYVERSRQGPTLMSANAPLNNIKLDIHVQTSPELQMRTAIARLSGDADLHLRGSIARPALLGRVDVLDGQATFHGTRYTLERGDITFANPVSIEPQLNLQAATHVRNYDLNITVTGTPDRGLNLNYRSEPPLPKSDIIALLALGRTGEESQQLQEQSGQSAFSDQATALILNQALNDTVSSRFQRLFGASNIKIDPQGLTTETNPTGRGPQVTIEQEFANNLSLTFSTNVSQSSQQIIEGEYYFNRNLSVLGTRDQNGVVSFDIQVRRRKN
jgi:translocation and assembly module TamB